MIITIDLNNAMECHQALNLIHINQGQLWKEYHKPMIDEAEEQGYNNCLVNSGKQPLPKTGGNKNAGI